MPLRSLRQKNTGIPNDLQRLFWEQSLFLDLRVQGLNSIGDLRRV